MKLTCLQCCSSNSETLSFLLALTSWHKKSTVFWHLVAGQTKLVFSGGVSSIYKIPDGNIWSLFTTAHERTQETLSSELKLDLISNKGLTNGFKVSFSKAWHLVRLLRKSNCTHGFCSHDNLNEMRFPIIIQYNICNWYRTKWTKRTCPDMFGKQSPSIIC